MRAVPVLVSLLLASALPAAAAAPSPILVSYSWDDANTDTGPDLAAEKALREKIFGSLGPR